MGLRGRKQSQKHKAELAKLEKIFMGLILKVLTRSIPRAAPLLALLEPWWLCGAGQSQGLIA